MPIQVKRVNKLKALSEKTRTCEEVGLGEESRPGDSHISDSANTERHDSSLVKPQKIINGVSNKKVSSNQPSWATWKSRPYIKLWELVALSKNIKPSRLDKLKESNPKRYWSYRARLKTAISWLNADLSIVNHPSNGKLPKNMMVSPKNFVQCAKDRGMGISKGLLKITEENIDSDSPVIQKEAESPFDPLPISGIAGIFKLDPDPEKNIENWKALARQAKRNGLVDCRHASGVGRSKSTFDPIKIGDWVAKKGMLTQARIKQCLANNLPSRSEHLKELIAQ